MKHIFLVPIVAGAMSILSACGEDDIVEPPRSEYLALTSPENLVENLQTAYRKQNIEEYAKLLAPEFRFKFQSVDASEIGLEYWNKDQDSTGTDALFRTPLVSDIRIDLPHTRAQDPTEVGFDPGGGGGHHPVVPVRVAGHSLRRCNRVDHRSHDARDDLG